MIPAKKILLILILALLLSPLVHQVTPVIRSAPLKGYFRIHQQPGFNINDWIAGSYQDSCAVAVNDAIAFKPDFVRLFNQVDYSLFCLPHAERIILGKKGYLLAQQYIDAYLGVDFAGINLIREKVKKYTQLQRQLRQKKGKLLLLIFPPDKCSFYPEYIPDRFLRQKREESNYRVYSEELTKAGALFLDFNASFLRLKSTDPYVLYPKTGIHWSNYGAMLAADSLTRFLEATLTVDLPDIVFDRIETSSTLRNPDGDMVAAMNLILEIPHPVMAYPVVHFEQPSDTSRLHALVIGDSFYWNWHASGYISNTFANEAFWYYNKEVYPEHFTKPTSIWDIDREEEIRRADVILILFFNGGNGDIGYGFLEELENYLDEEDPEIRHIMEQMRSKPEWMASIRQKAEARGVPLEAMMKMDARFVRNMQQRNAEKNQPR